MSLPDQSNREAWLAWRRQGIGSSDVPAIMGICPYKNAFEIFEDKTGRVVKAESSNFAIERGNRLEPIARAKFAASYNIQCDADESFEPKLYVMDKFDFMRTSLDGQSLDGKVNVEIKHQGKSAFAEAQRGIVQRHHYLQVQHQMLVSGAAETFLVSIDEHEQIVWNLIKPDVPEMGRILDACVSFWNHVRANRWPGESDDEALLNHLQTIEGLTQKIKELETWKKRLQDQVFKSGAEVCGPWRINTITRKGSVQYAKIPELKGVDLERYRGPETSYKTITRE